MRIHELKAFPTDQKKRKRKGRGPGSGLGFSAGRGIKGQKKRAGQSIPPMFEGGQLPLVRRVPKRGFKSPFPVKYAVFNLKELESKFPGREEISLDDLFRASGGKAPVKILGDGEVNRPLRVEAHRFSKAAREKLEAAGGQAKALEES
ncbi:MAG: 50S ribosomal protein L15 [Desulfohalobiaceae bacterium]|nr:50S ribosomal protein L15 [Desulfohalobiaceae bacterium]